MRIIETAADVDAQVLRAAEETLDWFGDEKIDWEAFVDRLADAGNHDEPPFEFESYDSPAVRKIQRHIRALKAT